MKEFKLIENNSQTNCRVASEQSISKNNCHIDNFVHCLSFQGLFMKNQISYKVGIFWRHDDLITSWLVRFPPKRQAVRVPILARIIVLLGDTLFYSHSAPLHPGVPGTCKFNSGAPYSYRKEKETHELIFSC